MPEFERLHMRLLDAVTEWLDTEPLGPAHSERTIQRQLGVERDLVSVEGLGVEAEADWHHLRTPETHLGYSRPALPTVTGRRGGRVRRGSTVAW
jgi:hypothetical protein